MEKRELRKHLILYVSITLLLITAAFSLSRAYFTMNIIGNDTEDDVEIQNATVDLSLTSSKTMQDNNDKATLMLIDDDDRVGNAYAPYADFSLTSTSSSTISVTYNVYLTECKISSGFISAYFKWELVSLDTSGTETAVASGDFSNATSDTTDGITYQLTSSSVTIAPSSTQSYRLRVWLSNDDENDQSSLLSQTFSAKVQITTDKMISTNTATE